MKTKKPAGRPLIMIVLLSAFTGCGGGDGSQSHSSSSQLAVSVVSSPMTVQGAGYLTSGTICDGRTCTLKVVADQPFPASVQPNISVTGGSGPYSYQWTRIAGTRAAVDRTDVASPVFHATVNWGEDFTETWQVVATDTTHATASSKLDIEFSALAQDNVSAQEATVPVKGSAARYSVTTGTIPGIVAYPIQVYVPADYTSTSDNLPVVYITDGTPDPVSQYAGWQFNDVCRILEQQSLRAVVVGLPSADRNVNYTTSGATDFYAFLTGDVIPFVESRYRIDPAKRILSGHSYGGLFAGLALTMDRPGRHYFSGFIMLDGAFWSRPDLMNSGEDALFAAYGGHLPGIKVALSSATQGNAYFVQSYYARLSSLGFSGLDITLIPPYSTQHLLMFDEAFSASIKAAYP